MTAKKIADKKNTESKETRPIPDNLPEEFLPLYDWWHTQGKKIALYIVIIVAIFGLSALYRNHKATRNRVGSEQLLTAHSVEDLEPMVSQYGSSGVGLLAQFSLAKAYYDAGRYDDALNSYNALLRHSSHPFVGIAQLGKAHVLEAQDNFDAAREAFAGFQAENSNHYLAPLALIGEARCIAQQGDKTAAAELLDTLIAAKTDTSWEHIAEGNKEMVLRYVKREKKSLFDQADLFAGDLLPANEVAAPPAKPDAEEPAAESPETEPVTIEVAADVDIAAESGADTPTEATE
ncbi:MAG: tetratricopeptide repeat protein [Lentisphaerae bacterium]|nr:tetratricopeptide repeat protein [Lentisphaerota bacterium]